MGDQGVGVVPRGTLDYFGEGDGRVGYVNCTDIVKVGGRDRREAIVGSPEAEACLIVAMIRGECIGHCALEEWEVIRGVGDGPVCSSLVNVEARGNGDREVEKLRGGLDVRREECTPRDDLVVGGWRWGWGYDTRM